jgi:hypothetical protein
MLRICLIVAGMTLFAASANSWSTVLRDAELDDALQGVWCSSNDGGKSCWGFDEFTKGTISSCGRDPSTQAVISAKARYEIRGNSACATVIEASATFALKPGDSFCVTVLDIDDKTQRFRIGGSSETATMYRVPRSRKRCPGLDA